MQACAALKGDHERSGLPQGEIHLKVMLSSCGGSGSWSEAWSCVHKCDAVSKNMDSPVVLSECEAAESCRPVLTRLPTCCASRRDGLHDGSEVASPRGVQYVRRWVVSGSKAPTCGLRRSCVVCFMCGGELDVKRTRERFGRVVANTIFRRTCSSGFSPHSAPLPETRSPW